MKVTAVKTRKIVAFAQTMEQVLAESFRVIPENSVIAISSKIVSLCEGSVCPLHDCSKDELIEKEADHYIPKSESKYGVYLTLKNGVLAPSAGIDESNTNGFYVLWPKDPQKSANRCWEFLRSQYKLENIGVIITDSITSPLRWGVTGRCIAHCGFKSLNTKIGEKDLFGKTLRQTRINIADGLAASAVLSMGESDEQTPLALIEEIPFVEFQQHVPAKEELDYLRIGIKDDLYSPLLSAANWKTKKL